MKNKFGILEETHTQGCKHFVITRSNICTIITNIKIMISRNQKTFHLLHKV